MGDGCVIRYVSKETRERAAGARTWGDECCGYLGRALSHQEDDQGVLTVVRSRKGQGGWKGVTRKEGKRHDPRRHWCCRGGGTVETAVPLSAVGSHSKVLRRVTKLD